MKTVPQPVTQALHPFTVASPAIAMVGGQLVLPLYMQNMSDFTAMESGLVLLPGAVVMGLMSPITRRIFDKFGAKVLAITGFTLLTVTTLMLSTLTVTTSFAYLATVNAVRMFGVSMVMMPVTTAALNQLPPLMIPHGTAVNNTLRQVAGSIGTAVLVTIISSAALDPAFYGRQGLIHGANVTFLVAAIITATGIVGSFFLKNSHGDGAKPVQAR